MWGSLCHCLWVCKSAINLWELALSFHWDVSGIWFMSLDLCGRWFPLLSCPSCHPSSTYFHILVIAYVHKCVDIFYILFTTAKLQFNDKGQFLYKRNTLHTVFCIYIFTVALLMFTYVNSTVTDQTCAREKIRCIEHAYTFLLSLFAKQYTVIIFA